MLTSTVFWQCRQQDEARLLEAAAFMDANECNTVIAAARQGAMDSRQLLELMAEAGQAFGAAAKQKFGSGGEW
jgi:4-hydroxy-4-methyl-2-oxoglutarate aldolase